MSLPDALRSRPYKVAILCGGSGSEREVSLVSGRSVAAAFSSLDVPCDLFELEVNVLPDGLDPSVHLVLPLVHGSYGEDGLLSAQLTTGGFAYAGCDQASSVLCFDKLACKAIAKRQGLPVAPDCLLLPEAIPSYKELVESLGSSFILKPRCEGSSVGLHRVDSEDGFEAALSDLQQSDYLAESYIEGCDMTVGILGQEAMGVVSIHPKSGLYDYEHKYTSGLSRYEAPARIPQSLADQLRVWSLAIYRACHCRDLARVDFRVDANGAAVFLEVNTLPGMTPTSLLPKSAGCNSISFAGLVLAWAGFALQRMEERI